MNDLLCLSNYKKYHCKCGNCRHTCCELWHITLSEKEYFSVTSLDCSKELKEKIDRAFSICEHPTEEKYAEINLNYYGFCPLIDEEGYCALQRECGAGVLPSVCVNYPRVKRKEGAIALTSSCEAVVETLLDKRLSFSKVDDDTLALVNEKNNANIEDLKATISLMQNEKKFIYDRLFDVKKYLEQKQNIKIDISKIEEDEKMISYLYEIIKQLYKKDYYLSGKESEFRIAKIAIQDEKKRLFIENVLVNHMFFVNFPYCNKYNDFFSSFLGLLTIYELLINAFNNNNQIIDDNLVDQFTYIFRLAEHTAFYYNCVVVYNNL